MIRKISAGAVLTALALGGAGAVEARQVVRGPGVDAPVPPNAPVGPRWGGKRDGRWWGGWQAPGGWGGYHRPYRGWTLPAYWVAPQWYVTDWPRYRLPPPGAGRYWSRYYDDAVLIDDRGQVYDTLGGVDWDRWDAPGTTYAWDDTGAYRAAVRGPGAPYAPPPPAPPPAAPRRDSGVGGAVAGAAVGGVAGAAIAGRGNRLGGALVGSGVGAAAGFAIDRAEDRRRALPPPRYGADYPPPGYDDWDGDHRDDYGRWDDDDYAPPPPPPPSYAGPQVWTSPDGMTTVTTTTAGAGHYAGGYFYPPATTTTVRVETRPMTRTTTTEYVTPAPRARDKTVWRPRTKTKFVRR